MTAWFKENSSTVGLWVALIAATAIIFAVSRGSSYQQLGLGLFGSTVTLLVILALFEAIWQIAARSLNFLDHGASRKDAPKSGQRRR